MGDWPEPDFIDEYAPEDITCSYCEADGLHWEQDETTGRWQLIEEDQTVHRCPETTGEFVFDPVQGFRKK